MKGGTTLPGGTTHFSEYLYSLGTMRPLDSFLMSSGMPFNNMYEIIPAITPYAML